jgi:hypothetical protein
MCSVYVVKRMKLFAIWVPKVLKENKAAGVLYKESPGERSVVHAT